MLELRNFKLSVKSKATGTPQGVYYIYALGVAMRSLRVAQQVVLYIYIGVGLSALLVSTDRAMRRPRHVERADDWLHAFWYITRTN